MNGIARPVFADADVRVKRLREKRAIVLLLVIVGNGEVAVMREAVRDEQIVRLVAAAPDFAVYVEADGGVDDECA